MINPLITLKEQVHTNIATQESVGKNKRLLDRKRTKNHIIRKGLVLFEKKFPDAFSEMPQLINFKEGWPTFVQQLCELFGSQNSVIIAHNAIAKVIDDGTKQKLWLVAISTHFMQLKRERPFKGEKWFTHVNTIQKFEKKWLNDLQYTKVNDEKERLVNCLISAVCHSGLNEVHHINALLTALQNKKPLKRINHSIYIELIIIPSTFNGRFPFSTNVHLSGGDDEAILVNRFFPTSMTLMFIYRYLNRRQSNDKLSRVNAWKRIQIEVKNVTGIEMSRKGFCEAGIGLSETKPNVSIPEALVEFCTKRNMSYSIPADNWQTLLSTYQVQSEYSSPTLDSVNVTKNQNQNNYSTSFGLIADLKEALRIDDNGRVRTALTALNAVKNCFDLSDHTNPLNEHILVGWLMQLLEQKKTTSTLTRYFSAIGALWISEASNINVDSTTDYFDSSYVGMLEMAKSNYDHQYKANLLARIHQFAVIKYGLSPITNKSLNSVRSIPHVRASYLSGSAFTALIQSIDISDSINSSEKELITIIFIVAFRTGMRLGEILKLKIADFEWSAQGWLFLRDNEYDHNKSNASRRKIPLLCLLTTDELQQFKQFIINRGIPKKRQHCGNRLLFSTVLFSTTAVKQSSVSILFSQLIKQITEINLFVFHSFRHTALSRLQLIIHYNDFNLRENLGELCNELIPYSDQQIDDITKMICGHAKRGKYWALCTFAGHRSPQITFNNYLHFNDLLTFCALDMNQQQMTKEQLWSISGLSRKLIKDLFKEQNKNINGTIAVNNIMTLLLKKIRNKNYCLMYKPTTVKNRAKITQKKATSTELFHDFRQVYELLHSAEKGESLAMLLWLYNITQKQINEWIDRATIINNITTKRNISRNISTYRSKGLIATLPKSRKDAEDVSTLVDALRNKLKALSVDEQHKKLTQMAKIVLCRTHTSNSAIIFRHPTYLSEFLGFFSCFPKRRWCIKINCNNKDDLTQWKKALPGYPNINNYRSIVNREFAQDKRNPNGQVILHLLSASDNKVLKNNNWQTYSTNIIKFSINIIAIIWLDKEKLNQLIDLA